MAAHKTKIILGIIVIAIVAWDIYLAITPEKMDTISEQVRELSRKYLVIPFSLGVVCGHWFWGKQTQDEEK